jgi:hypothetical protein
MEDSSMVIKNSLNLTLFCSCSAKLNFPLYGHQIGASSNISESYEQRKLPSLHFLLVVFKRCESEGAVEIYHTFKDDSGFTK